MNKTRMIALSGMAFLALSGAATAGQSSPQEKAETRQLNLQQFGQFQSASSSATPNASASTEPNATPTAAPTMPVQTADASSVHSATSAQPALAPMALNSLSNPPAEIATARVVDDKGTTIGAVQKVDIAGGKPTKVEIALLGSEQIVALDAGKFSYDKSNNVLTAALDKSQIVQLPAQPQG